MKKHIENYKKYANPTKEQLEGFIAGLKVNSSSRGLVTYKRKYDGLDEKTAKVQEDGYWTLELMKLLIKNLDNPDIDVVDIEVGKEDCIGLSKYFFAMILAKGLGLNVHNFGHVKGLKVIENDEKITMIMTRKQ